MKPTSIKTDLSILAKNSVLIKSDNSHGWRKLSKDRRSDFEKDTIFMEIEKKWKNGAREKTRTFMLARSPLNRVTSTKDIYIEMRRNSTTQRV